MIYGNKMSHSLVVEIFNNVDSAELIENIDDYDLNEKFGKSGVTPLIAAVRRDDFDLTEELIEEGANCNQTDNNGNTALIVACIFANNIEIIKALLKSNANPNIRNKNKLVAIEAALLSGNRVNPTTNEPITNREEVIKELLLYNAKIAYVQDYKIIERISRIARIAGIGVGEKTTNILSANGELKYE